MQESEGTRESGWERKRRKHPHAYRVTDTTAGIRRSVCDGCGHVTIEPDASFVLLASAPKLTHRDSTETSPPAVLEIVDLADGSDLAEVVEFAPVSDLAEVVERAPVSDLALGVA